MKKLLFILIFILGFCPLFVHAQELVYKRIKILIVPGHDNQVWGTQYGNLKEADMNLVLATQIYSLLKKDKRFEVYITRNSLGYMPTLADYFSARKDDILAFKNNAKKAMQAEITDGNFIAKTGTPHASVSADTALKLYGVNKWADENNIDAIINVHFDDYFRPDVWTIGKYKGFTVYMPEGQMPNAKKSALLAGSIFAQLSKKYNTSTFPAEKGGLIPDQKLIALGANDTLDKGVRSVLIEYGYIYQKIFRNSTTRHQAYKTMASLTATGIENYFFPKKL